VRVLIKLTRLILGMCEFVSGKWVCIYLFLFIRLAFISGNSAHIRKKLHTLTLGPFNVLFCATAGIVCLVSYTTPAVSWFLNALERTSGIALSFIHSFITINFWNCFADTLTVRFTCTCTLSVPDVILLPTFYDHGVDNRIVHPLSSLNLVRTLVNTT